MGTSMTLTSATIRHLRPEFRQRFPDICPDYPTMVDVGPKTEVMNTGATGGDPQPVSLQPL